MYIDGNEQSEVVPEEDITKMVQTFKCTNPKWEYTKVVMSDKDFNERAVFKKEFPNAALHICLFHVQRNFRREVTKTN